MMNSRWTRRTALVVGLVLLLLAAGTLWAVRQPRLPSEAIVVPRDVATLQAALDRSAPGDVIILLPSVGIVHGPVSIEVPGITITSWKERIPWTGPEEGAALTLAADDVSVRGISVRSEAAGILIGGSDTQITDTEVQAATVGIELRGAVRCTLRSVHVRGGQIGLLVGEGASQSHLLHGSVSGSSYAGVLLRNVDAISVRFMTIRAVPTGILVEDAQVVEIERSRVEAVEQAGIRMDRTVQSRVQESTVQRSQQSGIVLIGGRENALVSNHVSGCGTSGLLIEQSPRTLVQGNAISDCADGIRVGPAANGRFLRNTVSDSRQTGLLLVRGQHHQVHDNAISGGEHGMVSIGSRGTVFLRNTITSAQRGGISVLHSLGQQQVVDNVLSSCAWGLLGFATGDDLFSSNALTGNRLGILLIGSAGRLHVDGNLLAGNDVGLKWQRDPSQIEEDLRRLGVTGSIERPSDPPLLTRNLFQSNAQYDIQTEDVPSLSAGGNWWGEDRTRDPHRAVVSENVSLETTAWRGSVAVGGGSSTVELLLGTILKQMLIEAGYQVVDLVGLESSERVLQAFEDGDADIVWLRPMSTLLPVLRPDDETVLWTTMSVVDGWRLAISPVLAESLSDRDLSALSALCSDRDGMLRTVWPSPWSEEAFEPFLQSYGLSECLEMIQENRGLEEVETLLKLGSVEIAIVPRLEETLSLSGFVLLKDDRNALSDHPLLLAVRKETLQRLPELESLITEMEEHLTSEVVHRLVSQIRLLRREVEQVARDYLAPSRRSND